MFDSDAPRSPESGPQVERVSTVVVGRCAGTVHHLPNLLYWPRTHPEIPVQSTLSDRLRREHFLLLGREPLDRCGTPQKLARLVSSLAIRAGAQSSVSSLASRASSSRPTS